MTDNEKEAIRDLKQLVEEFTKYREDRGINGIICYKNKPIEESISELLNLIQKQQEEIKNAYWKGYTTRDAEAQNICKTCKYRAEKGKKGKNMEEEIVKEKLQGIAKKVDAELPEGFGFIVLTFMFGKQGQLMYCSNANRNDVVAAMKEFIDKTENNYGNDTGKY